MGVSLAAPHVDSPDDRQRGDAPHGHRPGLFEHAERVGDRVVPATAFHF
jgi:hypothetical protein